MTSKNFWSGLVLALGLLGMNAFSSSSASAQDLRRAHDRGFLRLGAGLGYATGFDNGAATGFKLDQHVDLRIVNTPSLNLLIGVMLGETFGSSSVRVGPATFSGDVFLFDMSGRFTAEIGLFGNENFALAIAPYAGFGFIMASGNNNSSTNAMIPIGAEVRAAILDGLLGLWVRPLGLQIVPNGSANNDLSVRYEFMGGAEFRI